jgi:hypothetical protein
MVFVIRVPVYVVVAIAIEINQAIIDSNIQGVFDSVFQGKHFWTPHTSRPFLKYRRISIGNLLTIKKVV